MSGEAWQDVAVDRLAGYRQALATADIPFDPDLVAEGNWQPSGGYHATRQLLQLKRPPTAIFCANDRMALGCYDALKEAGLRIPQDVSVVGFDDDDLASHMVPRLTTFLFPRRQMGAWAAERALSSRHRRHDAYRTVKIECELLERDSVALPKAKPKAPIVPCVR